METNSPLLDSLVAYWTFDDVLTDATGRGNNGTGFNSPTYVAGKVSNAVHFASASSQYVRVPASADMNPGTDNSWSIALWVNLTTLIESERLLSKWNDPDYTAGWHLMYSVSTNRFIFVGVNDNANATTFGAATTGTWIFIVFGYDAVQGKPYISVNAQATPDYGGAASNVESTSPLFFGIDADAVTGPLNGSIDEVGFWHRLLTAAEITSLYNSGNGTTYPF